MRSFALLAVLSAVLSAGAAQACCFFKCGGKSAPAAGPRMQPMSGPGYGIGLTITYVATQPVVNNHVANAVDSTRAFDVTVEQDYMLGQLCDPELTFTDNGPHNSPARAAGAAATTKTNHSPYKHTKKEKKYKKVVIGMAATGGAALPDPIEIWIPYYEVTYSIPKDDLGKGHDYSVYASCPLIQSDTVYFYTAP